MAEIKRLSTELQVKDKLLDTSGDAGTSGQILSSTGTGTNWIDNSSATIAGSGTATYIPKFTTGTAIGSSLMFQAASNNFSIGVTTPNATFSISGDLSIGTSATDVLRLHNEAGV